jgi:hypothetical protein
MIVLSCIEKIERQNIDANNVEKYTIKEHS